MLCVHFVLFSRLNNLLKCEGSYALGGDTDRDDLYIAPTIITDVSTTDAIMCEEVHKSFTIIFKLFIVYIGVLFPCTQRPLLLLNVLLEYYKELVESKLLMVAACGLILSQFISNTVSLFALQKYILGN